MESMKIFQWKNEHFDSNAVDIPVKFESLTHCGLVTPYGGRDLGQHWLRKWLVAWRHQAITWTNVDLPSVRSIGIHSSTILQEILQASITKISWKITFLKFLWTLPGANELNLINFKARYGGSNMKKINNGGRLLIFYMMEGIKKVNRKNGILWLFGEKQGDRERLELNFWER